MGMPVACIHALWHPWTDADDMVMEGTFAGIGRCLCVLLRRPQDDEGIEMGRRRIPDVYKETVSGKIQGARENWG